MTPDPPTRFSHPAEPLMRALALAGLVCLLAAGGCARGPKRVPLTGRVTLDGKPLSAATVVFEGSGGSYSGAVEGGAFEVKNFEGAGLPPGKYTVTVLPRDDVDRNALVYAGQETRASAPPPGPKIPGKYADPATSGLTAEVLDGANPPVTFDLKP